MGVIGEEGDYYLVDDGYYYDEDGNIEYEYYYDDGEEQAMDSFFDDQDLTEWVVTNEVTDEYDADWLDDSKWDQIDQVITYSAKKLTKKCMNLFGRKLCLCEFMEFVAHKKHVCHPGRARKKKQKIIQEIKQKIQTKLKKLRKSKKKKSRKIKKEKLK